MRRTQSLTVFVSILACLGACKSKPEAPAPVTVPSAPPAIAAPSVSATPSPAAAVSGLPEAEVKRFVAGWEAAQNERDFAAYGKLYAERFMGVKRVGTYSKRFDRAAWLVDRKPMVEGGAKVRVTELELVAAAGATRAVFTQEFTSTGFRDVGKKELFLVAAPGGIAISREEMLSSEVSSAPPSDESVLAYHRNGPIVQRGFDKSKLQGKPRLVSVPNASPIVIAFEVAAEALNANSRAWLGREVTAYTTNGETCSGRVARFEVRVQSVPHFGMRQSWNGEQDAPKASSEEVAQAVERMAQNEEHFVVGILDHACAGTWASAVASPFAPAVPVTGKLRDAAVAAFKALPAYAELQRRFVKESGNAAAAWESVDGVLKVVEVRATARPPLLLVTAQGGVGCANFSGALSAFWQNAGTAEAPKLTPSGAPLTQFLTLRGAIDAGGADGLALLAGPDSYDDEVSVLRLSAPKSPRRVLFATSFWDCDC